MLAFGFIGGVAALVLFFIVRLFVPRRRLAGFDRAAETSFLWGVRLFVVAILAFAVFAAWKMHEAGAF